MGVLVKEVAALYTAFAAGQPSPLAELPIQYADYAVWQREWLRGEVLERQLATGGSSWREQPPVLELPSDHPRPAVQSFRGSYEPVLVRSGTDYATEGVEPARRSDAVHAAAGSVADAVVAIHGGRKTWWWGRRSRIGSVARWRD